VRTPAEEVVVGGGGGVSSRSVQRQWLRICDGTGWWLSRRRLREKYGCRGSGPGTVGVPSSTMVCCHGGLLAPATAMSCIAG
jgi:hypothetical protein